MDDKTANDVADFIKTSNRRTNDFFFSSLAVNLYVLCAQMISFRKNLLRRGAFESSITTNGVLVDVILA